MLVGVFAGTKIDTQMGVDLLEKRGIETLSFPLADNPQDQTRLQYFSKEDLERVFMDLVERGKKRGMDKVFIYCNSLSGAIDYKKIEVLSGLKVISPLDSYLNLEGEVRSLFIMGANGQSAFRIEELIKSSRPELITYTLGNLSLVEAIEEGVKPARIVKEQNIENLLRYVEGLNHKGTRVDSILLGCTHFPYIKEELQKLTTLNIIDPAEDMIRRLDE